MIVETMYNKLAINTGFPLYVDENEAPETTRFLLEMLNQALLNVIDTVYISNNVLERRDNITLVPNRDFYPIEGMVKSIQYTGNNVNTLVGKFIRYDMRKDITNQIYKPSEVRIAPPMTYVIDKGNIRLYPIPDKAYEIRVTVSTTNLVWANDDTSKGEITDVTDAIMASKDFCDLVVLRACAFLMGRCQNPMAEFYNNLYTQRLKTFIERDGNSFEKPHLYNPIKGHYSPRRGLID